MGLKTAFSQPERASFFSANKEAPDTKYLISDVKYLGVVKNFHGEDKDTAIVTMHRFKGDAPEPFEVDTVRVEYVGISSRIKDFDPTDMVFVVLEKGKTKSGNTFWGAKVADPTTEQAAYAAKWEEGIVAKAKAEQDAIDSAPDFE